MTSWTVSLELPECEGDDPVAAVEDFQHQANQVDLFAYRAHNNDTGITYLVDMADNASVQRITRTEDASA